MGQNRLKGFIAQCFSRWKVEGGGEEEKEKGWWWKVEKSGGQKFQSQFQWFNCHVGT